MIYYFLVGAVMGLILGYVIAALMCISNTNQEKENLESYIDYLESTNEQLSTELEIKLKGKDTEIRH